MNFVAVFSNATLDPEMACFHADADAVAIKSENTKLGTLWG